MQNLGVGGAQIHPSFVVVHGRSQARETQRRNCGSRAIAAFRILVHFLLKKRIKHLQIYFSHVYFKGDTGWLLQNWRSEQAQTPLLP